MMEKSDEIKTVATVDMRMKMHTPTERSNNQIGSVEQQSDQFERSSEYSNMLLRQQIKPPAVTSKSNSPSQRQQFLFVPKIQDGPDGRSST